MEMTAYPPSPTQASDITISNTFKKQVTKVIASILLFCLVYILLVIAVFAVAIGATYLGIVIMIAHPGWLTLLLGCGLIATGVSLIYFIVKFIGTVNRKQNPGSIQIYQHEHPALFEFLQKVATETGTIFPKKVFLSPDVNAAVFYNSSFLSMFFPVKKNLEIGLGLVNSINLSEFKAIVAHEFGHFSQRSMKVGSFIYNVNLVLYNMLYENTSYTTFLQQWGSLHGLLALFASITVKISQFIQWILRGMYRLINKEYSALRREMEFHADAIAASVAGGNNLVSALAKAEVAESCYQKAIEHANEWLGKQKQVPNIFDHQRLILQALGEQFGLPIKNNIPEITYQFARSSNTSRINIKNQWASHPSLQERKQYLDSLNTQSVAVEDTPWQLFNDPKELQQLITDKLYLNVEADAKKEWLETREYEQWLNGKKESRRLPAVYNGFYNDRYIALSVEDIEQVENIQPASSRSFDEIFSTENGNIQADIDTLRNDIATVGAIRDKTIEVKSFDFDGQKYTAQDTESVIKQLTAEMETLINKREQLDKSAYEYFYLNTRDKDSLRKSYCKFSSTKEFVKQHISDTSEIEEIILRIGQTIAIDDAVIEAQKLKNLEEEVIKPAINKLIDSQMITIESNADLYAQMIAFQSKSYHYFFDNEFLENEIDDLFKLNNSISYELNKYLFLQYKLLLEEQYTHLKSNTH